MSIWSCSDLPSGSESMGSISQVVVGRAGFASQIQGLPFLVLSTVLLWPCFILYWLGCACCISRDQGIIHVCTLKYSTRASACIERFVLILTD